MRTARPSSRSLSEPPRQPPRGGRVRCRGRRPPNARTSPCRALRLTPARACSRSSRKPRLPSLAAPGASATPTAQTRLPIAAAMLSASATVRGGARQVTGPCARQRPARRGGAAAPRARRHRGRAGPGARRSPARHRCPTRRCWPPSPPSPSAGLRPREAAASAFAASCSVGVAAACPTLVSNGEPVEQQVERTPGFRPEGGRARTARQMSWQGFVPLSGARTPRSRRSGRSLRASCGSNGSSRSRRLQQQRRSITDSSGGERDQAPEQIRLGAAGTRRTVRPAPWPAAQAPRRSAGRKLACAAASARSHAERRLGGQDGRPFEQRRRGREAAAALGSSCGALEVGGHGFVRSGGGERAVPGAAVGGELGIAHLRQRVVHAPSFVERRGSVYR